MGLQAATQGTPKNGGVGMEWGRSPPAPDSWWAERCALPPPTHPFPFWAEATVRTAEAALQGTKISCWCLCVGRFPWLGVALCRGPDHVGLSLGGLLGPWSIAEAPQSPQQPSAPLTE